MWQVFPAVNPTVVEQLSLVDAVVYGMGSLYTSICPSLVTFLCTLIDLVYEIFSFSSLPATFELKFVVLAFLLLFHVPASSIRLFKLLLHPVL